MAVDLNALVESAAKGSTEDFRTLMQSVISQLTGLNAATGLNFIEPTNSTQKSQLPAPPPATPTASGANGNIGISIQNPSSALNLTVYHQVRYSGTKNMTGPGVVMLEPSSQTSFNIPAPGAAPFVQLRSSYDRKTWNDWQLVSTTAVDAGLVSSSAQSAAVSLNQSNFANVDSVALGGTAALRVYGTGGPYTSYQAVRGSETPTRPSATIIGVPLNSTQYVSFEDGNTFHLSPILPGAFPDGHEPVGITNVVDGGAFTEPTITLTIVGGTIVGATWTGDNGLSTPPVITVTDAGGGTGAVLVATGVKNGKLAGIQILNGGQHYTGATVATATGGASAPIGGGTAAGGNGGRLIPLSAEV